MNKKVYVFNMRCLEFVARYLWWIFRPFVRRHLSKRCARCNLPETCSHLNGQGICQDCTEYISEKPDSFKGGVTGRDENLDILLRATDGKESRPIDALILFSGGKDSTYLLHRVVNDYPNLRVVTLLVDNGFMSPIALENAERIKGKFPVDHHTLKLDSGFVKKAFQYTLTHLEKQNGYSIVDFMDGMLTFNAARNLATQMRIPLVLSGISKVQAEKLFDLKDFELPLQREIVIFQERTGIKLSNIFNSEQMQRFWTIQKYPHQKPPRFLFPFMVWDPSEQFILSEVGRLGLLDTKKTSPLLTNNSLIPAIVLAELARFGYTCFEVEFAQMVRTGQSNGGYWRNMFEMAEFSAKTGRLLGRNVNETLKALGLTREEIGIPS